MKLSVLAPLPLGDGLGSLERDAHGVRPLELQRFARSRLPESEAGEIFNAILGCGITREQLTDRLSLAPDAITDFDLKRLRRLLSLWHRWASDSADMARG